MSLVLIASLLGLLQYKSMPVLAEKCYSEKVNPLFSYVRTIKHV